MKNNNNAIKTKLPSEFLPKRTAQFWRDTILGFPPKIKFYKRLKSGEYEIHNNSTDNINKIFDLDNFFGVLKDSEYELSLNGESDIAIFRYGNIFVPVKIKKVFKRYFPNGDLMYYRGIVNFDQGDYPWIIHREYFFDDNGDCILATKINFENSGEVENISVEKFNKLYKQNIIEKMNLGKIAIPVVTMTNRFGDRWGSGKPDAEGAEDILERLDEVETAISLILRTARTKIYVPRADGTLNLGTDDSYNKEVAEFLDTGTVVMKLNVNPNSQNQNFQISSNELTADKWYELRKRLINEYRNHVGEMIDLDANGTNKQTAEIQSRGDDKFRVGTSKISQRIKDIKSVLNIVINYSKLIGQNYFSGLDEIRVKIKPVDIREEIKKEERIEKLLNMGLMSKKQAVQEQFNFDDFDTELYFSQLENDKESEEDKKENEIPLVENENEIGINNLENENINKNPDDNLEIKEALNEQEI